MLWAGCGGRSRLPWRCSVLALKLRYCLVNFSLSLAKTAQSSLSLPVIHKILTMISIQRSVIGTEEMLTLLPLLCFQSHSPAPQALLLYAQLPLRMNWNNPLTLFQSTLQPFEKWIGFTSQVRAAQWSSPFQMAQLMWRSSKS